MPNVTIVMTRRPLAEFLWEGGEYNEIDDEAERTERFGEVVRGRRRDVRGSSRGLRSGQWGTMKVVQGPALWAVSRNKAELDGMASLAMHPPVQLLPPTMRPQLTVEPLVIAGQWFWVLTDAGSMTDVGEYDTMERFRTDTNKGSFYVRVMPRPFKPYPCEMYKAAVVEKFHRKLGIRAGMEGACLRVLDHDQKEEGTSNMAGILFHEAPNIAYLIGCISPRERGNRLAEVEIGVCVRALDRIYSAMGGFAHGKRCNLLIVD